MPRSMPAATALSTGFTDEARTRTASSPSPGSGSDRSSRTRGSGSKSSRTNPFISKSLHTQVLRLGLDPLPQSVELHVREEPVGGRRVELIDVLRNPEAKLSPEQLRALQRRRRLEGGLGELGDGRVDM